MFKLFVTVLVMSSTGSVSQNAFVTDYDDPVACQRMAKEINGSTEVTYGIHTARVFAKAACDTRQRGEAGPGVPPPVAQMFDGFSRFIQQQGR